MKLLDLDAIEARANAAYPGPWRAGTVEAEGKVWAHDPEALGGPSVGERCVFIANTHFKHTANRAFVAHAREDVPALVARVRRLQALVAVLVTHERDNGHSHACVGTWDRSNGAPLGGAPCARCHTFADAREAIGLPRWPTRDEYHQRARPHGVQRGQRAVKLLRAHCPRCDGTGHVPAAPDADPLAKVYGEFHGDTEVFGQRLDTTATELADLDPRAVDVFGVPIARGDLAMHVAGVDRSRIPARTLEPGRVAALGLITVRSRDRVHHDARPSIIVIEPGRVLPLHHVEWEACRWFWTSRGVAAWAASGAGPFSASDLVDLLNAKMESRFHRLEAMHVRSLRRFLDAMREIKLLDASGRGRFVAAGEGAR